MNMKIRDWLITYIESHGYEVRVLGTDSEVLLEFYHKKNVRYVYFTNNSTHLTLCPIAPDNQCIPYYRFSMDMFK